jgi:hypothetical protein
MSGMQMSSNAPKQQAVELRTGLEELFGQDVFVGIRVTRSRLRGDPDFTQAAVDALSRNSDDLTTLLGRVYGSARAQEFRRLWESQQEGWSRTPARPASTTRPRRPPPGASSTPFPGR